MKAILTFIIVLPPGCYWPARLSYGFEQTLIKRMAYRTRTVTFSPHLAANEISHNTGRNPIRSLPAERMRFHGFGSFQELQCRETFPVFSICQGLPTDQHTGNGEHACGRNPALQCCEAGIHLYNAAHVQRASSSF